jgi:hypothetical protein
LLTDDVIEVPGTAPEPKFQEYDPILDPVTGVDPEETKLNELLIKH